MMTATRTNSFRGSLLSSATLVLALLAMRMHPSEGFSVKHPPARTSTRLGVFLNNPDHVSKLASAIKTSSTAMPMLLASTSFTGNVDPNLVTSHSSIASSSPVATELLTNTALQAELFNDLAHFALDFVTLFGPSTLMVRLAAVIGRIFAIAADYIPDHNILPEEVIIQLFMLAVGWNALVMASLPALMALFAEKVSIRDSKAYAALFAPAGVSMRQFQSMAVYALDWIELAPGETIRGSANQSNETEDHEYIYWLHAGEVVVDKGSPVVIGSGGGSGYRRKAATRLFGEASLWKTLKKDNKKASTTTTTTTNDIPPLTAGAKGATLLRMHRPNLQKLMEYDPDLAQSIRTLLFEGLQAKLAAQQEQPVSTVTA